MIGPLNLERGFGEIMFRSLSFLRTMRTTLLILLFLVASSRERPLFDWIADTGDGFNSSFSVWLAAVQPELNLTFKEYKSETLYQSDILILGGDLMYPKPTKRDCEGRFLSLFNSTLSE